MAPKPLPPEQIKTPTGIGINEGEGGARESGPTSYDYRVPCPRCGSHERDFLTDECIECRARARPRTLRRFVARGGELVEVESVMRETR